MGTRGPSIMLAVHCKRGEPVDLKDPVLEYVSRAYGQQVSQCSDTVTVIGSKTS